MQIEYFKMGVYVLKIETESHIMLLNDIFIWLFVIHSNNLLSLDRKHDGGMFNENSLIINSLITNR